MMETPLISIIIPVYNAQRFLRPCLKSVLAQEYENWELIAVNDGSKDGSLKILKEFAHYDNRIRIIDKSNEGVSIARNTALQQANGEWVYFIDADDFLMPHAIANLQKIVNESGADLVRAEYIAIGPIDEQLFTNKKMYIRRKFEGLKLTQEIFYTQILLDEYFIWICLFNRNIIEKYDIRFIPKCRFMEDAAFLLEYMTHCNKLVYSSDVLYKYRIHGDTAGHAKINHDNDITLIYKSLEKYIDRRFVKSFIQGLKMRQHSHSFANVAALIDKLKTNILYLIYK